MKVKRKKEKGRQGRVEERKLSIRNGKKEIYAKNSSV
jgi:hypothetical protein